MTNSLALLQEIVRRERRSLIQYMGEAFPWADSADQDSLNKMQGIVAAEGESINSLAQFLIRKRHGYPNLGSYPDFTGLNFIALEHWLPLLIDAERRGIAALERDLPHLDDAEARPLVQSLLDLKRRDLESLQHLTVTHRPATSAAP